MIRSGGFGRFAAVGLLATAADVAVLFGLTSAGLPAPVADTLSISLAATVSFLLHRSLTFPHHPQRRFVEEPLAYLGVTAAAGVVDVMAVGALWVGFDDLDHTPRLLVAKAFALALAGLVRVAGYRRVLLRSLRAEQALRVDRGPAPGEKRVSVVIPAYRAERGIAATLAALRAGLGGALPADDLELIVVDDGSPDATADAAGAGGADRVIRLPENKGKGAAVRTGALAARGRSVVFVDDDLSYGAGDVHRVIAALEEGWDLVVGSRKHIDTTTLVRARRLREVTGRLFNILTTAVLLGQYRDTQCGLKGFRSDTAKLLFERSRIDGFAFDVELFHLAERYRLSLLEIPVELSSADASRVRVGRDSLRMITDLFRIRRFARGRVYGPDDAAARHWFGARRTTLK